MHNILSVNLTLETKALSEAANTTNDEVKKISAWAAILFAPTLVGTIYGMNFEHMPELSWLVGYPFALMLMVATSVSLYLALQTPHLDLAVLLAEHACAGDASVAAGDHKPAIERGAPFLAGSVMTGGASGRPVGRSGVPVATARKWS